MIGTDSFLQIHHYVNKHFTVQRVVKCTNNKRSMVFLSGAMTGRRLHIKDVREGREGDMFPL